jgi:hypothetical protein
MEQMIKTYKFKMRHLILATTAHKSFRDDAAKLLQQGWKVKSMVATESTFNPAVITVIYEK